jgi:hypothetical protein
MPIEAGTADKFGNRYEALWTIDCLLAIVDGRATALTLESIEKDESRGVEFHYTLNDGTREYWSVKRQTARAAGWTLNLLTEKDEGGRSIVKDLASHVERNANNFAVFASTLGTPELDELRLYATTQDLFAKRLNQSKALKEGFTRYLLPVFSNDEDRALTFLRRSRTNTTDEAQLRDRISFSIRKIFYRLDGGNLDPEAVRGLLAEFLLNHLHQDIQKELLLRELKSHSIGAQDWSIGSKASERLLELCRQYVAPLQAERINGGTLRLEGAAFLDAIPSQPQKILVAGKAGGGKSTTLAALVERLIVAKVPVLPIRFDQLPEGILSTKELGAKLLLSESPALVLAGIASGGPAVMVIDQLDAISLASGRRTEGWSLFESFVQELAKYSNVSLVVGCREFDLEHDRRMRALEAKESNFVVARLGNLPDGVIDSALSEAGTAPESVSGTLRPILSIPLHLALFLRLSPATRIGVHNRDELFSCYWEETEQKLKERLGSGTRWTQVIDRLVDWLSENQELSAPAYILDEYAETAKVLASQHFLVLIEKRYRFFHESLFDYAFARRFVARGGQLHALLTSGEQHLFRRAQVRQVLSFYRSFGEAQYFTQLSLILNSADVRFHIRKSVLQWMSSIEQPRHREWITLHEVIIRFPELTDHILGSISNRSGWFDIMDSADFFDQVLSGEDVVLRQRVIWLISLPTILEHRGRRVAEIIERHRHSGMEWTNLLLVICRTGSIHHDRKLFDFYLSLIDDDVFSPKPEDGLDFWSSLHTCAEKRPDYAAEAISHWFGRQVLAWRSQSKSSDSHQNVEDTSNERLKDFLQGGGQHMNVVAMAATSSRVFCTLILPQIVSVIRETAKDTPGYLRTDPIWYFRSVGDTQWSVSGDLFEQLARSLEDFSRTAPAEVDALLQPYEAEDSDSVAFLILRAWAAAPNYFAGKIIDYLLADRRRLKVGYAIGGGSEFISSEAVRLASAVALDEKVRELELGLLAYEDEWEMSHRPSRGYRQFQLLTAFDSRRLSADGRKRLQELQRKFPSADRDVPAGVRGGVVPSPIPPDAMEKMTDEQWLRAMSKYSGVDHVFNGDGEFVGGERQLATYLQSLAQKSPSRFIALAGKMGDDLSSSYFEQISYGVAAALGADKNSVSVVDAGSFIRKLHSLPGRPCGRAISWLVQRAPELTWPNETFMALVWYATEDPDPSQPSEAQTTTSILVAEGAVDVYHRGLNSARGAAAESIGNMLFSQPRLSAQAEPVLRALSEDTSSAVRACVMIPLLAWLNIDAPQAIVFFHTLMAGRPELLRTPYVIRFIHFASLKDFESMRPYLKALLGSGSSELAYSGAQQLCLLSFDIPQAATWIEEMAAPSTDMRKAFANVYAANVADLVIGEKCRKALTKYFLDLDDAVRVQASTAFEHLASLDTSAQSELLESFLASDPSLLPLIPVVHALVRSPVQLPDLVCKLAERCLAVCRKDGSDLATSSAAIAMDLSKIVVRLYAQTDDELIRSRCLSLIDDMEFHNFVGVSSELDTVDR